MSEGVKYDNDKPRWGLLPYKEVEEVVDVLTFGSKKYSDDNWKKVPNAESRYFDAMLRHITEYRYAEKLDKETNKSHLAHAICCALFIMYFDNNADDVVDDNTTNNTVFGLTPNDISGYFNFTKEQILDKIMKRMESGISLDSMVDVKSMMDKYGQYYQYIGHDVSSFKFKEYNGVIILSNDTPNDDIFKPLRGNGKGVELEPISDDICTTSKLGVGIASLSTDPKPKEKNSCCYHNFGNVQEFLCEPDEILECLQKTYDGESNYEKSKLLWFNMDTMKSLLIKDEYVYVGKNSTELFMFKLSHGKFMRLHND